MLTRNRKIVTFCVAAAGILCGTVLIVTLVRKHESRREFEIAATINNLIRAQGTNQLIQGGSTPESLPPFLIFMSGPLSEGEAVLLVNNAAAFWIQRGSVFVVNDAAQKLLPQQPMAPPDVTYGKVLAVVK